MEKEVYIDTPGLEIIIGLVIVAAAFVIYKFGQMSVINKIKNKLTEDENK